MGVKTNKRRCKISETGELGYLELSIMYPTFQPRYAFISDFDVRKTVNIDDVEFIVKEEEIDSLETLISYFNNKETYIDIITVNQGENSFDKNGVYSYTLYLMDNEDNVIVAVSVDKFSTDEIKYAKNVFKSAIMKKKMDNNN